MTMNYNYYKWNKQFQDKKINIEQENNTWILDRNCKEGLPEEVTYTLKSRK